MNHFLITLLLLVATNACAQTDTLLPFTHEDSSLLVKIQLDWGRQDYDDLKEQPFEPIDSLELKPEICSWFLHDSLFSGVIKTTYGDSAYLLERCVNGKLNGEKLRMLHIPWHTEYFVADYYSRPSKEEPWKLYYEQYNDEFFYRKTGCIVLENDCKGFENFFGSDDPGGCTYKEWYPNGKLKSSYKTGVRGYDGYKELYYPNGQLQERTVFSNGIPTGEWTRYSESGEVVEKLVFRKKKAHGYWDGKKISSVLD